jgi:NagD protein
MPDIGATIAFVEASTGRRPDLIIGKPNRTMVEAIYEKLQLPPEAICMVGDRLSTDIALGQWGMVTILVLSGETKEEDLIGSPFQPDYVMKDLDTLVAHLRDSLDAPRNVQQG